MLINCLIYNLLVCTALLYLVKKNPRFMMQDYPKQITDQVEPKTEAEKRASIKYGMPFLALMIVYPLFYAIYAKMALGMGFLQLMLNTFLLVFSFNLVDLIFVDWLIFCTWTPKFIVIPGTEGNAGYKDYKYHFTAFLKGCVFSVVMALVLAIIVEEMFILL